VLTRTLPGIVKTGKALLAELHRIANGQINP
jgi:hypothetical protein